MKNSLFPVSLSFLLGVIASAYGPLIKMPLWVSLTAAAAFAVFVFIGRGRISYLSLLALLFATGVVRAVSYYDLPSDHIRNFVTERPETVVLEGRVADNPVFRPGQGFSPRVTFLLYTEHMLSRDLSVNVEGLVMVKAYMTGERTFCYGDRVRIRALLSAPAEKRPDQDFDYRSYLARKKIFAVAKVQSVMSVTKLPSVLTPVMVLRRALYDFKNDLRDFIVVNLVPPHSYILAGMLLGERQLIDVSLNGIFMKTGTMHIIAISGLHFTVIIFVLLTLFGMIRLPQKLAYALTIVFIVAYANMVGDVPSLWRSVIMASIILMSVYVKRQAPIVNVFSCSLIVLLAVNPGNIFDVGFVLSYACVASLIWIMPLTDRWFGVKRTRGFPRFILQSFSVSTSVWLGVFPIVAYCFKMISPVTLIANLVAVPLSFAILGLGIAVLLTATLVPFITMYFFEAVWLINTMLVKILTIFTQIPGAFIPLRHFTASYAGIYYLFLLLSIVLTNKITHLLQKNSSSVKLSKI